MQQTALIIQKVKAHEDVTDSLNWQEGSSSLTFIKLQIEMIYTRVEQSMASKGIWKHHLLSVQPLKENILKQIPE